MVHIKNSPGIEVWRYIDITTDFDHGQSAIYRNFLDILTDGRQFRLHICDPQELHFVRHEHIHRCILLQLHYCFFGWIVIFTVYHVNINRIFMWMIVDFNVWIKFRIGVFELGFSLYFFNLFCCNIFKIEVFL